MAAKTTLVTGIAGTTQQVVFTVTIDLPSGVTTLAQAVLDKIRARLATALALNINQIAIKQETSRRMDRRRLLTTAGLGVTVVTKDQTTANALSSTISSSSTVLSTAVTQGAADGGITGLTVQSVSSASVVNPTATSSSNNKRNLQLGLGIGLGVGGGLALIGLTAFFILKGKAATAAAATAPKAVLM